MTKKCEEVALIVQARLSSERVPEKMIRPFGDTTLLDILFEKLGQITVIPQTQIFVSAYDEPIKQIARNHKLQIYHRSEASALEEASLPRIFEWHDMLPKQYKYVIIVSACNPLLKVSTIEGFIETYLESTEPGAFAVIPKKTYYWTLGGESLTDWKGSPTMNTKYVDTLYEAAHCLYASPLDLVGKGYWMSDTVPPRLALYPMDEIEAFDIDYEWQFRIGEKLYEDFMDSGSR
jgi:CMP-N-acetylneuraminic acid synthetase